MTQKEFREYFEGLAKGNLALSHDEPRGRVAFKSIIIEQVLDAESFDIGNICLFIEKPRIKPSDALSDNPRKMLLCGLLIMEPRTNQGANELEDIYERTEEVVVDVISKLRNDVSLALHDKFKKNPIHGLDLNSIDIEPVGMIFNSWYGYRASFTINQTFKNNLRLDPRKWRTDKPY